ncbi:PilZ domain-containing protein [Megalodesulfovibrio paquesii]
MPQMMALSEALFRQKGAVPVVASGADCSGDAQARDRRSFIRVYVRLEQRNSLVLVRENGQKVHAALLDISIGGARVQFLEPPPAFDEGEILALSQCSLERYGCMLEGLPAQVVWAKDVQAGLLFEKILE